MSNRELHLYTIIEPAIGESRKLSDEEKKRYPIESDSNEFEINLVKEITYFIVMIVGHTNNKKYKIEVKNITDPNESNHPKSEQTLKGGKDTWSFTLIV